MHNAMVRGLQGHDDQGGGIGQPMTPNGSAWLARSGIACNRRRETLLARRSHHEVPTAGQSGEAIEPRCFRREGMFALFIVTSVTIVTSS
jgi:hypothetical protein